MSEELWMGKDHDFAILYDKKTKTALMVTEKEEPRYNYDKNGNTVLTSTIVYIQEWTRYNYTKARFKQEFSSNYFYVGDL